MSTKFVSKQSNYMLVLKPGIEGSRALGTHATPGLYIKFQSGFIDVKEQKVVDMLREHPSFGVDFLEVKEDELDPYADIRDESEPAHIITEIKYGHTEKSIGSTPKVKLTPAMKRMIEGEAMKMLPGLLKQNPKILKDIILGLSAEIKANDKKVSEEKTSEETAK